jgi:sialate O-acetylesterase
MHKLKILFSVYFLLGLLSVLHAQNTEKVIGTITERAQVNNFGPDTNGNYGYQFFRNDLNIDASQNDFNNLVLKMRVYIENFDNPDNLSFIQTAFGQIELGNIQNQSSTYITWQIKNLNLKTGWNELYLDLSSGKKNASMSTTNPIKYFRFILRQAGIPEAYSIRIADVQLVDKSMLVDPPVVYEDVWNTDYLVGNIDYNLSGEIKNANGFSIGKTITPINASAHNPKKLYLLMDVDITEQNTGDLNALLSATGQIELTSGGVFDKFEKSWNINDVDWKIGKYTYSLSLNNALSTGGTIDLANINYMRIFAVKVPSTFSGNLSFKVSNVRIVDYTNQTSLPTIFSDHMMFQQNKPIKIWGYAVEGKNISVNLLKNGVKIDSIGTVCSESKKWEISFPQRAGGYDKYQMIVFDNGDTLKVIDDILIGEIWLSAGQSNMALTVSQTIDGVDLMSNANNANIRFFLEPTYPYSGSTSGEQPVFPEKDITGSFWRDATRGAVVAKFSAVAYSMALKLQEVLNIPVGVLNTSVGGSVIEAWLPREDIESNPDLVLAMKRKGLYFDVDWWVNSSNSMTALYNQKIAPLSGFNIAGVIWYQGEGNSSRPELYSIQLDLLKKAYERQFGFTQNSMPFVFSQVCPWLTNLDKPHFLSLLSEAMYDAWALHPTSMGMLPLYDMDLTYVGNVPIHPTNKTPVGKRFATSVINLVYNTSLEYTAPVFESFTTYDDKIRVRFNHVDDGLKTIDGLDYVRGFSICGEDSIFVHAKARIVSESEVEVWNDYVKNPTQVTYAWATYNVTSNLANSVNIVAAPFRSDRSVGYSYFNPQDWVYADGDIWGINSTDFVGFIPAWQKTPVADAINLNLSYNESVKSEGKASLKVDYTLTNNGKIGFGPVFTNKTTVRQLNNFNIISFDIYNPDERDKSIELWLKDKNNAIFKAVAVNSENELTTLHIGKTTSFDTINFNLRKLKNEQNELITYTDSILNNVISLQIIVGDNNTGAIYIDNVVFGKSIIDTKTSIPAFKNNSINIKVINNRINISTYSNNPISKIEVFDLYGCKIFHIDDVNKSSFSFNLAHVIKKYVIVKAQTVNDNLLVEKILIN